MEQKQWAGSTYGSGWMHRCLIRSLRFIDVRFLYLFSAIFVIPVCLVLNESRKEDSGIRQMQGCMVGLCKSLSFRPGRH